MKIDKSHPLFALIIVWAAFITTTPTISEAIEPSANIGRINVTQSAPKNCNVQVDAEVTNTGTDILTGDVTMNWEGPIESAFKGSGSNFPLTLNIYLVPGKTMIYGPGIFKCQFPGFYNISVQVYSRGRVITEKHLGQVLIK